MATLEAPVRPRTALHQGPFVTEPFFDFRNEDNARRMRAALAKVRGQLGGQYDLIIGGKRMKSAKQFASINPAKPSEIVGRVQSASAEQAQEAVAAAQRAFSSWSRVPAQERAQLLFRAAEAVQQRRDEFDALLVLEVGNPDELVAALDLEPLLTKQVRPQTGVVAFMTSQLGSVAGNTTGGMELYRASKALDAVEYRIEEREYIRHQRGVRYVHEGAVLA